jgi:hypothetical protein
MVVELIEQMHADEKLSYRQACGQAGVGYSSFMRWRRRCINGEEPAKRPGPAKVEPVDMKLLVKQIEAMHHGRHRSEGTGELYREHKSRISRRDLAELFNRYGPPLFLKRDTGGNLNHHEVDKLLQSAMVIPLNSPCYYPQYNGSMERAQREIKKTLAMHVKTPNAFLAIQSEMDIHELNHQPRPALGNQTPCSVFRSGQDYARSYTLRKRKEVYESIREKTLAFAETEGYDTNRAWRRGVRTWLQEHRFITVTKG